TFALAAGSDGKGVLSVAVNPAFLAKKVVTQLDYEIDKFYKGSTMSFIVVKGQRAAADFANGGLAIPLYQELSSDNIYVLRLRLLNNLNKADYEWSQPITIGLAAPAAPAPGPSQALSTPQSLRIPKTPPAIAMPF
ncbi:MAG: hypothetical protein KGK30_02800, partial [Elusimicrobia bacterium]|nr:hypothetical protein [Elusimicrobiota bacterium]